VKTPPVTPPKRRLSQDKKLFHEKKQESIKVVIEPIQATRQLEGNITVAILTYSEIQYSDLAIKFDGALLSSSGQGYAYVFKGYWKGYPVAVRFPALKVPIGDDERQKFVDACAISYDLLLSFLPFQCHCSSKPCDFLWIL
jgi:hypothetical protein